LSAVIAIAILLSMSIVFGALLGYAAVRFRVEGNPLVEQIDRLLPQTQCGQCDYPGCKPYAEALATGDDINKCIPGGEATMLKLAELLGVEPQILDQTLTARPATRVTIVEEDCIGCTKCIQACPVDAILGAARHMHTVIADDCTGCDLCIPVCPVDCIEVIPVVSGSRAWRPAQPGAYSTLRSIDFQWEKCE